MATIKQIDFEYKGDKRPNLKFDPSKKKWIGYRVDIRVGKKRRQPVFPSRAEAEDYIRTVYLQRPYRRDGLRVEPAMSITIRQLFERRLKAIKNPKEIIRATRIFRLFEDGFEYVPKVTEIRQAHIQLYINERLESGVQPQTVSREITILSTAFKDASILFPFDLEGYEPPKIVRPKYNKRRRRDKGEIEPHQKDRIIEAIISQRLPQERLTRTRSRPVVAFMFEIGWMLGLRLSEISSLNKTDFDKVHRSLRVTRWKTGDVDTLRYLPDRAIDVLAHSSEQSSTELIFDLRISDHTFSDIFKRACIEAKMPYGRSTLGGITFHSTRHSFVTRMSQIADPATTQSYSGHSDKAMVLYYTKATENAKKRAMERLYGGVSREDVLKIFKKVQSDQMSFDEFLDACGDVFS